MRAPSTSKVSSEPDKKPSRTLREWYDHLDLERWRKWKPGDWRLTQQRWDDAHWRTKFWWLRQRLYRAATAQGIREWWNEAREMADSYAHLIDEWYEVSRREQLVQMFRLHIRRKVAPWEYYAYKLYRPDRCSKSEKYIFHYPHLQLTNFFILRTLGRYETPTQGDKRRWHAWANKNQVPTPRVLASFEDGSVTPWDWNGTPDALPECDLFCKPVTGHAGEGTSLWVYNKGMYQNHQKPTQKLSKEELVSHLKSTQRTLLLQEREVNHPKMEGFTAGGLATCRLVTGRSVEGRVLPLSASLKLPCGNSVTDNPSSGGIVAPVDISTGQLGVAVPKFPRHDGDRFKTHPDTGRQVTSATFPYWDEVKKLALDTHKKLPKTHFVGWDITLSSGGPVIIEPNTKFGASSSEYPDGTPLTNTPYGLLFDEWMQVIV